MTTSELRIGNIVEYECTYHKITSIFKDGVRSYWLGAEEDFIRNDYNCSVADIKPIPLTEEILLKCKGIVKLENQLSIDRFVLSFQPKYNFWYVLDSISLTYISKIEFLHEWLNLYFFLNGEELEINL